MLRRGSRGSQRGGGPEFSNVLVSWFGESEGKGGPNERQD